MKGNRHQQHHHHLLLAKPSAMVLSVALLCCSVFSANGFRVESREIGELLERSLAALERMVDFFGQDYGSINVDGLFGIRTGQGSVNQTEKDCAQSGFHCPRDLVHKLAGLSDTIDDIASHALPYIQAEDPEYYSLFHLTLDGPYILQYNTQVLDENDVEIQGSRKYNEGKGDKCLSLLMGTYKNNPKCSISDECWEFMTRSPYRGYVLTHQLLYFMIADKNGCVPPVEERLHTMGVRSLREHRTHMCGRILADAKDEEHKGRVKIMQQDLFLEQSLLCGAIGYQNFMTPDWVRMVLSWQNDQGCYTMMASLDTVDSEIDKLRGEEQRLLQLMKEEARHIDEATPGTGRKLLREKVMKGHCLAHKTGLAFGLTGAYIRHFVRLLYGPPDLTQHH